MKILQYKILFCLLTLFVPIGASACSCAAPPEPIDFDLLDLNHDSFLTYRELQKALKSIEMTSKQAVIADALKSRSAFNEHANNRHWYRQTYVNFWMNQARFRYSCGCDQLNKQMEQDIKSRQVN